MLLQLSWFVDIASFGCCRIAGSISAELIALKIPCSAIRLRSLQYLRRFPERTNPSCIAFSLSDPNKSASSSPYRFSSILSDWQCRKYAAVWCSSPGNAMPIVGGNVSDSRPDVCLVRLNLVQRFGVIRSDQRVILCPPSRRAMFAELVGFPVEFDPRSAGKMGAIIRLDFLRRYLRRYVLSLAGNCLPDNVQKRRTLNVAAMPKSAIRQGLQKVELRRFELPTSALRTQRSPS